jgi:uncharacterized membrane protein YgdD (TMEM256/DUF423 family)
MSAPRKIAALLGALGVGLGAFGAHGLRAILEANQTFPIWQTASQYHLLHAVVLLYLSGRKSVPVAAFWSFTGGILIFSGTLYILAYSGFRKLGAITPVGGALLILGWLLLLKPESTPGTTPEVQPRRHT